MPLIPQPGRDTRTPQERRDIREKLIRVYGYSLANAHAALERWPTKKTAADTYEADRKDGWSG